MRQYVAFQWCDRQKVGVSKPFVGDPPEEDSNAVEIEQGDAQLIRLVDQISRNDPGGMEELYRIFSQGVRQHLQRHLGAQDVNDQVHDCFIEVVNAIQAGALRDPRRLMGFLWMVVRFKKTTYIRQIARTREKRPHDDAIFNQIADSRETPEQLAESKQRRELMHRVLSEMSERDREILSRFYLNEESAEQICESTGLTPTQFRLLKSKAKSRLGELAKEQSRRKIFGYGRLSR